MTRALATRAPASSVAARLLVRLAVALFLLVVGGGCAQEEPEPAVAVVEEPEPVRVEVTGEDLVITDLPAALRVDDGRDDFVLVPVDGSGGELTVRTETPERGGVNLVAAWQAHKEAVEAATDGEYKGKAELVVPFGTAFQSRGRYVAEDGTAVEEVKVFVLHPEGDRMIVFDYAYPATDDVNTRTRVEEHVFPILGSLELETADPVVGVDADVEDGEVEGDAGA